MLEKLRQIWRILFPPKPKPAPPPPPPRKTYSMDELMRRGEELKELHRQQQHPDTGSLLVCPSCRAATKDIRLCSKCGRPGCDACMTYDPMEGKFYCDDCWNQ